jgi:hypothetical protein
MNVLALPMILHDEEHRAMRRLDVVPQTLSFC